MSVLKIKSTNQLYEEYKILFLKQIKRNSFTKEFFEVLQQTYNVHLTPPKESYFSIINDISNKYDLIIDINMNQNEIKENLFIVNNYYRYENEEIINNVKLIINKTGTSLYDDQAKLELKLLLTVNFRFFFFFSLMLMWRYFYNKYINK
jgi:hypothetical protein